MTSIQRPDSLELADYTGVLRRRWPIVVVAAIIGVVGAFAYTLVAQDLHGPGGGIRLRHRR